MKLLKHIYESIVSGTMKEYYQALFDSYKKKFETEKEATHFIEFLKQNDQQMSQAFGFNINIEKEDNGTMIIAYGENKNTIFLVGIVSNKDKMSRNDISAMSTWIDRLIEKMKKEHKYFLTTPHELSLRLVKHIEDKLNNDSEYSIKKEIINKADLHDYGFDIKDEKYRIYYNIKLTLSKNK